MGVSQYDTWSTLTRSAGFAQLLSGCLLQRGSSLLYPFLVEDPLHGLVIHIGSWHSGTPFSGTSGKLLDTKNTDSLVLYSCSLCIANLDQLLKKVRMSGQSDYSAIWRSAVREDEGENQKLLCISYGKWLCLNCTLLIPEVKPHGEHLGYQFILLVLHAPPSLWLNNSLLVCTSVGLLLIFFHNCWVGFLIFNFLI
jgi:hypothetical protein